MHGMQVVDVNPSEVKPLINVIGIHGFYNLSFAKTEADVLRIGEGS